MAAADAAPVEEWAVTEAALWAEATDPQWAAVTDPQWVAVTDPRWAAITVRQWVDTITVPPDITAAGVTDPTAEGLAAAALCA